MPHLIVFIIVTIILNVTDIYVYKDVIKGFTISMKGNISFWNVLIVIILSW